MTTDDVDAAAAFLSDQGVPIVSPPVDRPWGERMAYVADPDGYRVMLDAKLAASEAWIVVQRFAPSPRRPALKTPG